MRKLVSAVVLSGFVLLALGVHSSFASEVDSLLQKLIDKGILSASEAQEIRTETNEEITKADKQKQEDFLKAAKDSLPDWIKNTKFTGDFRLRYEYKQTKATATETNRGRFRLRAGFETQVNDKVKVGFTLATGVSDSSAASTRSNNQSFGGVFNKKPVIIDKAYVEYKPFNWLVLTGGKFANPIWEPSSFIWDPDITPEGGAVTFKGNLLESLKWFANTGILVLENSDSNEQTNPFIVYIQPGLQWTPGDHLEVKAAVSYYNYDNVKNHSLLNGNQVTNTSTTRGGVTVYKYNYNTVTPGVEIGLNKPFELINMDVPSVGYAGVFGSYANNVDVSKKGNAWIGGLKFGAKSIKDFGDWQATTAYKALERDAVLDVLPDDDFYSGKTGVRGNVSTLEYGLAKNTSIKATYYHAWLMAKENSTKPFNHFMLDLNYKW